MATHTVCRVSDIEPGTARRFDIAGTPVAVIRIEDDFYAISDTCSHADYSLAEGEVDSDDRTIECWKHGSAFSLLTGEPHALPATRPVPVYDVEVVGDEVQVTVS